MAGTGPAMTSQHPTTFEHTAVILGLDPRIHDLITDEQEDMDPRVKPGDEVVRG